jgi:hypothetical protein
MLKNMLLKNMFKNKRRWTEDTDFPICAICSTEYEPSFDNVTILFNCYHKFHTTCLKKYIEERQVVLTERETEAFRWVGKPLPSQEDLDYIADNIECPSCNTTFSVYDLVYDNYKSANIWPINPNAPIPELSEAPEDLNDIFIYKNEHRIVVPRSGVAEFRHTLHIKDYPPPSLSFYELEKRGEAPRESRWYKDNLGPRCPYPHILPHIQIPQLTDPLEFIEMQYKAAVRNNTIALNEVLNVLECNETYYGYFRNFLERKGITMSDVDIAYNKNMKLIAHDRLVETERVETTIKQILDNAKSLLGRVRSRIQRIGESIRESVSRRIEGGKKKSKKYRKHKSRKPRKK